MAIEPPGACWRQFADAQPAWGEQPDEGAPCWSIGARSLTMQLAAARAGRLVLPSARSASRARPRLTALTVRAMSDAQQLDKNTSEEVSPSNRRLGGSTVARWRRRQSWRAMTGVGDVCSHPTCKLLALPAGLAPEVER